MDEIEVLKLELQLHNLDGRIMQHKLALMQIPIQEKELDKQIIVTLGQIEQTKAQLETFRSATDTASI